MFQFLIGRLQTVESPGLTGDRNPFQFLIGRLQTGTHDASMGAGTPFQFLIGRLQTWVHPDDARDSLVLIPHR